MKKVGAYTLAVALCVLAALFTRSSHGQERGVAKMSKFYRVERPVPGRYVVVLKKTPFPSADAAATASSGVAEAADELVSAYGGVTDYVWESGLKGFVIELPEAAAERLSQDPRVELVEEDTYISSSSLHFDAHPRRNSR